ncbi:MAG: tetratricopeptide repeat protein [Flavobacteriaceae bacterium]
MATYKKRGAKKSIAKPQVEEQVVESTTAEVFESLDSSASKTEEFVANNQNIILSLIGAITVVVLGYLAYDAYVLTPKKADAVSELNQAQYYFNLAVNGEESDALYQRAINGGDGKYGFLDIIENYSGTPAAGLAQYSIGMAYLNTKDYEKAISYLEDFSSDDVLLSALAKGALGDAHAQLGNSEKALQYYKAAANASENDFTTPKYLFKAGLVGASLGKNSEALNFFKRIQNDFSTAPEAAQIEIQIGRLENQ